MGDSLDHPNFSVFDDFLAEDEWTKLWTAFQFMTLRPVTRTTGAWKLDDGAPLAGAEEIQPRHGATAAFPNAPAPPNTPASPNAPAPSNHEDAPTPVLAHLLKSILSLQDAQRRLLEGPWDKLVARPYVYPRGTGLSWHVDDHELYAGAFVYYAHPHWDAHFGGELLVAETDGAQLPVMGYRFETQPYSDQLLDVGCGNFVAPKPNRLVVLGAAPHMVCPVRDAAGQSVRASVAGFFLKPQA